MSSYEQRCRQCEWEAEGETIDMRHHECADVPTESEPEREKCHQFYCPNQPAWIPAGQNGCPHCGGTATRGFCICETASADEIRDMYTPPASETPHDDGCGGCDLGIWTPSETPSPEVGAEYQFEVWQGDDWVAGGSSENREEIEREAAHYAAQYAQDGPVEVKLFVRYPLAAAKEQSK